MSRMLLGETQEDLASAIKDWFSIDHYTVDIERNGLRILECLRRNQYDVIVMEMVLGGLDGISVVRGYRAAGGAAPIALLSDRQASDEFQCGLDAGADTIVVKPFQLCNLAAQLRALLRRPMLRNERILTINGLALDTGAGTLTKDDILVHLHPMEFKLLQFLLRHPNQVFNAQAILERVWQKDEGQLEDTVRTHVRALRRKLDSPGRPSVITTVRGLGYKTEPR